MRDLYNQIIDRQGLKNTLEAHIYRLVFQIDTPLKDNSKTYYNGIQISQPTVEELPYVCNSFYNILFDSMDIDTIIKSFTNLLFEEKIIVAMD